MTALALGIPAAVKVRIESRRQDSTADIARIQRGDLGPPAGLVAVLFAAAVVLLETAWGEGANGTVALVNHLVSAGKAENNAAATLVTILMISESMIMGVSFFLLAVYASQFVARRPFRWTATAVGAAFALRALAVLAMGPRLTKGLFAATGISMADFLVDVALVYLGILCSCLVGAWLGARYHDAFLARKLARVESKVAQHTATLDPGVSDTPEPESATTVNTLGGTHAAPVNHQTWDPYIQLAKLTLLRDAGALSTDEFHAKKTEILRRI